MVLEWYELRDESELESILRKDPEQLEGGLIILTGQRKTGEKGRLDLLGVDPDGRIVVIELKAKEDDRQLQQALDYYDWTLESIDFIRDAYKEKLNAYKREIKGEMPRIILVAPEFNDRMLKAVKYLNQDIEIMLLRYVCFKISEDRKEIVFLPIDVPPIRGIEEKPRTMQEFLDYIKDPTVGEL